MTLVAVGCPRRVRWVGPPVAVAVGRVRRDLPRVLLRWRVREEVIDEVLPVVGELLDNVLRHARTEFSLLVELDERRLRVAVEDDRPGAAPLREPRPRVASRGGLRLVDAAALPRDRHEQDNGRTVWAEFSALHPSARAARSEDSVGPSEAGGTGLATAPSAKRRAERTRQADPWRSRSRGITPVPTQETGRLPVTQATTAPEVEGVGRRSRRRRRRWRS